MLGYCGFVRLDTWVFQKRQQRRLDHFLVGHTLHSSTVALLPDLTGGLIGRLEIARLGISVMVMEGTSSRTLRLAAGHISGTSLPGQPGNIGVSGHRDTFFRPLRNIRQNDFITLTTPLGSYHYRVVGTSVLDPSDVHVLDGDANQILTLVTCYPFYFVGSAPERFIVRAERFGNTL
jgi:sortase A